MKTKQILQHLVGLALVNGYIFELTTVQALYWNKGGFCCCVCALKFEIWQDLNHILCPTISGIYELKKLCTLFAEGLFLKRHLQEQLYCWGLLITMRIYSIWVCWCSSDHRWRPSTSENSHLKLTANSFRVCIQMSHTSFCKTKWMVWTCTSCSPCLLWWFLFIDLALQPLAKQAVSGLQRQNSKNNLLSNKVIAKPFWP